MSRPKLEIDWNKVDLMLEAHATGTEVAASIGLHPDTFYLRVQDEFGIGFSEYSRQKKEKGKTNLRAVQYKTALQGDKTMQIWLGRNWLRQREEPREDKEFDGSLSLLLEMLKKIEKPSDFKKDEKDDDEGNIK